jgi:hypothetical protein
VGWYDRFCFKFKGALKDEGKRVRIGNEKLRCDWVIKLDSSQFFVAAAKLPS